MKYRMLERVFGYHSFRPGQEELVDGLLAGRDVFGIMPTGGGKSICYQLPALLSDGITLVISPLISLMRDQVLNLKASGIGAAYINSTLTMPQLQMVYRNLLAGRYKLVYVAPERLEQPGFAQIAAQLPIRLIAVDEAHCISQWGQDFRPSYLRIADFIASLPRRPAVGAFTATATDQVRDDVIRLLGLRNPVQTVTGFDRPNLYFEVRQPESKEAELLRLLDSRRDKSGIVYCSTRKNVERVTELLQEKGFSAARYHAGLEDRERSENQEDFLFDRVRIIVATNAFGMGIDKSNVSFVLHYNMPKSLESYYQEAGRAGRDGTAADCILLFSPGDVHTARFLIQNAPENEDLEPRQRELVQQQDLIRLDAMVGYCKTTRCLRGYILDYFGQRHSEGCGNCGNCLGQFEMTDITRQAQMILSCARRIHDKLGYWVGATLLLRVLRGSGEKSVLDKGLDTLSTYGLLRELGTAEVRDRIDFLIQEGYLYPEATHQTLSLTEQARQVLFQGRQVQMPVRVERKRASDFVVSSGLDAAEEALLQALREKRTQLAKDAGVPAFMIFSNATLQEMAKKKPTKMSQFRKISGVGELKASWYARDFLDIIRSYQT